jgi:hypothetical protein
MLEFISNQKTLRENGSSAGASHFTFVKSGANLFWQRTNSVPIPLASAKIGFDYEYEVASDILRTNF